MDVGFIGLGQMGFHMARRLTEAGHRTVVFDTRREAVARLAALGAEAADSPRAVADRVETVMASLPTPEVVLAVATGPGGVIEGSRMRRFVDLSTTGAVMAKRIFERLAEKRIVQIDCPVSGGVTGASKGTLALMVSGPRTEVAAIEPLLPAIGRFFFIGERPGAGQTMKLCNNFLSAAAMTATSEAMVMGVKAGLDPRIMLDVINSGTGRNTATEDKFGRVVLPRAFNLGFTVGLMTRTSSSASARARRWACRCRSRKPSPGCCRPPATRTARRRTSPPWCRRSSAAPGSRCAPRAQRARRGSRLGRPRA